MIGRSRHRSFERTCFSCKRQFTLTLHNKKQYCDRKCAGVARCAGGQIAQKVDETTLRNHGVKRVFQDTERIKKTLLDRYGVEYITKVPGLGKANWLKAHETKKKNGTYASSRIERAFCERLAEQGVKFDVQVEVSIVLSTWWSMTSMSRLTGDTGTASTGPSMSLRTQRMHVTRRSTHGGCQIANKMNNLQHMDCDWFVSQTKRQRNG